MIPVGVFFRACLGCWCVSFPIPLLSAEKTQQCFYICLEMTLKGQRAILFQHAFCKIQQSFPRRPLAVGSVRVPEKRHWAL